MSETKIVEIPNGVLTRVGLREPRAFSRLRLDGLTGLNVRPLDTCLIACSLRDAVIKQRDCWMSASFAREGGAPLMQRLHLSVFPVVALLATLVMPVAAQESTPVSGAATGSVTVVASGLANPRGVTWAADGTLYVAQAGKGGEMLGTPALAPPLAPATGGPSASVVRIDNGCPVLVAGDLPSVITAIGEVLGAEDLAVLGGELYAAVDGGGEAHGNAAQPSGVYRILQNGTSESVADLSAWVRDNPTTFIPPDFDPDAAGFSLVADEAAGALWVVNPNSGEIISVTPGGAITRIVDISVDHPVITGLAVDPKGGVYVGNLTGGPLSRW